MTKINKKMLKIGQIDPKSAQVPAKFLLRTKSTELAPKILQLVPKPTGQLKPSCHNNFHLWSQLKNYETYSRSARVRVLTIINNFEWFCTISNHFPVISRSIVIYLRFSPSISFYLGISSSISGYLWLYPAMSGYLSQSLTISTISGNFW